MLLVDHQIRDLVEKGELKIEPYDPDLVGPASIDLRLGFRFRVFRPESLEVIDIRNYADEPMEVLNYKDRTVERYRHSEVVILKSEESPFVIHPGEFVLASIYEYVELPDNVAAQINGRSSIARLGLLVHTSAGWVDPGYRGHLTLEIYNVNSVPIRLYPLTRVAQLTLFMTEPAETPYNKRKGSKYVGEEGATHSLISRDFQGKE